MNVRSQNLNVWAIQGYVVCFHVEYPIYKIHLIKLIKLSVWIISTIPVQKISVFMLRVNEKLLKLTSSQIFNVLHGLSLSVDLAREGSQEQALSTS